MRNERDNVKELLESLSSQSLLENFDILALDDESVDETLSLLEATQLPNLRILKGKPLQPGWLGKNFACHQLANATDARYLVFVDADVRLEPEAVAAAISKMNEWGWDFISPYPKQIARSLIERLVQPLLQWSWFASVPLRFAEKFRLPSMAVANGQFLIVKRSAYVAVGGHEAIKGEVIDDVELSRSLIRAKFKGFVAEGSQISQCRMYKSGQELIAGYAKSQWRAFGNLLGAVLAVLILFLSSVLPAIFALQGIRWAVMGYLAVTTSRMLVALRTGTSILTAPLHPLSALIWIGLIKYSWIQKWRGKLVWKARAV